ncbi:unnamed protein product [Didymodactylos carnosus]|uniref:RING-type E3 ubiquitin transferase n=1 Tax=Didymodactylos carnosus TaxID=1234261 RepID=A0A813YB70_9BILA|nr:unnamed protein product [Didymodactylos carnosus]CAF0881690.1 unnamed protein product [Didymodactylos carnosus]CAF3498887.1 unnamed protein product [Didymodactylos carnosus]CAF3667805.1 unnamed protein product [Didymodactylos carnosus]
MAPYHVLCDYCGVENFADLRYCCEICDNYDLCGACYADGKESLQHSKSHPMTCIPESSILQMLNPCMNLPTDNSLSSNENYNDRLSETEYLTILLDYCLQRFNDQPICCCRMNTIHLKERFADALNWTYGFAAKLSGSHLTSLLQQYVVKSSDNHAFVLDIDTGSPLQIRLVERTQYPGFYYIQYNSKNKYHSTLQNLDIFEERNNKQYISSRKLADLLQNEFSKYADRGPCLIELHGPAVSTSLANGKALQDFVFSLPMLKIPYHIREQWLNRSKQWPSTDIVEMVSNSSCHLVPKCWCRTNEGEEDPLTWRLSLSFAEVLLTNSWNKQQRDYYRLLKLFIQDLAPDMSC